MSSSNDNHREQTSETSPAAEARQEGSVVETVFSLPSRLGKSAVAPDGNMNPAVRRIDGIMIGRLEQFSDDGRTEVSYPGSQSDSLVAVAAVTLVKGDIGKQVALAFLGGDPAQPVILGLIQHPATDQSGTGPARSEGRIDVQLDGERVTLSADKEIVLKCGKASITLTRAGKIIVKGAYISTHSTGVNRIKGGSVQLN